MAVLSRVRNDRRWAAGIIVLGFLLRLAWVVAVPVRPVSDGLVYDQLAWNLATRGAYAWNNGDITAYWPVGTAFVYSLVFRCFGHALSAIAALNVVVGTATLCLIVSLARRWLSGAAAGLIYALWPSQIEFTSIMASELLFNFLLLLSLWAAVVAPIRSWPLKGLVAGILLAAAAFVRPTALPLVLLLAAAAAWGRKSDWRALAGFTIAALAAMVICIAPWTLRNARELGAPVLISTNGSANLWMGNNPQSTGEYMPLPDDVAGMSEVARSAVLAERAKQFILAHPARDASLFLRKLVITHDRETIGITWNEASLGSAKGGAALKIAKAISSAYWWLALALGAVGAILLLRLYRWRALLHPVLLAWGYFAVIHGATVGADRYHFPSIPFIAMLAGYAAVRMAARLAPASVGSAAS